MQKPVAMEVIQPLCNPQDLDSQLYEDVNEYRSLDTLEVVGHCSGLARNRMHCPLGSIRI